MRRNCSTEEEEEKKLSELEERLRERQFREDIISGLPERGGRAETDKSHMIGVVQQWGKC